LCTELSATEQTKFDEMREEYHAELRGDKEKKEEEPSKEDDGEGDEEEAALTPKKRKRTRQTR
jgi:hypothetical protein